MRYHPKQKKQKSKRSSWQLLLMAVLVCTFCFAAFMLAKEVVQKEKEKNTFSELADIVSQADTAKPVLPTAMSPSQQGQITTVTTEPQPTDSGTEPLAQYAELYEQNPDFFGWLAIEGTEIDYPVMYTPDSPEYYLKRDFYGAESVSGTLFVDGNFPSNGNCYLIHGHRMKNKTMFGRLSQYAEESFFEEHRSIRFDTLYEQREYQVIAAFYSRVYRKDETGVFRYYQYTALKSEEDFDEFIRQVREAAIFDTDFEAEYGDEFLMLSTCSYHTDNGRFVVVAKRIDTDEG